MKKLHLTVLTQQDVERRYEKLKDTRMARYTEEAINEGASIGILQYDGLSQDTASDWLRNARNVVAKKFNGQSYKIGVFTDLSKVKEDKLYFAFKTKKCTQIAHSLSGCDEEGFMYNC